jgi:hypothetical protein
MIQYSFLGRSARLTGLNTTSVGHFEPVWFSLPRQVGKHGTDEQCVKTVLPEDGDWSSPRNVVFKPVNAADGPRRLCWISCCMFFDTKLRQKFSANAAYFLWLAGRAKRRTITCNRPPRTTRLYGRLQCCVLIGQHGPLPGNIRGVWSHFDSHNYSCDNDDTVCV